jgi:regulator of sigma E protease
MDFIQTLFYFILVIGILVAFHEFGHFWVARKVGVKVLRFSIGFGKVLCSFQKTKKSTEYVLSAIPLGGYVKMLDEREGPVSKEDLPFAFNRQALWKRMAIVVAGPVFNLLLAIVLFWVIFITGETGMKPVVGPAPEGTLAAQAEFVKGEEILKVDGKQIRTWTEAMTALFSSALAGDQEIEIEVRNFDDETIVRTLVIPGQLSLEPDQLYESIGLVPWTPEIEPVVGTVLENGAAAAAGLKTGDLIISADGNKMQHWMQWVDYVRSRPDVPINLVVERDGVRLQMNITPEAITTDQESIGKIGVAVKLPEQLIESMQVEYSLSPLAALQAACDKTWFYSVATLKLMGYMLIGKAPVENLSGPISIAQYAGQSADMGLTHFLKFLAMVSISLGILNLLPIPVLDGGHLMFYFVEAIKGSPVSEKIQIFFQNIGVALLITLMVVATFLDIERLFQ